MPPYPLIELELRVGTWDTSEWFLPDTGYDGGVAIPAGVAREILAEPDFVDVRLGHDGIETLPSWAGTATIGGREFRTDVTGIGSDYLVGLEVLNQLEICFEFGQRV